MAYLRAFARKRKIKTAERCVCQMFHEARSWWETLPMYSEPSLGGYCHWLASEVSDETGAAGIDETGAAGIEMCSGTDMAKAAEHTLKHLHKAIRVRLSKKAIRRR